MSSLAIEGAGQSSRPLVSIGIPLDNGEVYLDQALESAVDQTYQPI